MRAIRSSILILSLVMVTACQMIPDKIDPSKITSINILDRNGLSQTISTKDRLGEYNRTNFLAPQPYQKVMRVYGREKSGDVRAQITSYHPNGEIKQYLEASNNRANGQYCEWFPNGQLKIQAYVIGGAADLNTGAEESWLFDGLNHAWDEEGHFIAEIPYSKGVISGVAHFYHPNGNLWKETPYSKNCIHGEQKIYLSDGTLLQKTEYKEGLKDGEAVRYWDNEQVAYYEISVQGNLSEAAYYNFSGQLVSEIKNGTGFRAIFDKEGVQELQEFKKGVQDGVVKVFDNSSRLARTYSIEREEKVGEEIDYFPGTKQNKLLLTWHKGVLQGPVKTWYKEGNLESQREMSQNKKNGLLTAWYRTGALMMVEEYDCDQLLKGEYYRMGEKIPISKIENGKGVATLFNSDGNFLKKIHYESGRPVE